MASAISVSRKSVIGRKHFRELATLDHICMQTNINRHFDLDSRSHGMKIEVKQIDDNNSWLYN